jgi:indoleamine 2,3-dioxygenase
MVNKGLEMHHEFFTEIREIFSNMWKYSNPISYLNFRTFIMGITGNDDIFPNGVVYEGCFDGKPQYYRGETGA